MYPDINKLHTTELGEVCIRRNLDLGVGDDVMEWCANAAPDSVVRRGKNWYVCGAGYVLTINVGSHTIITVHSDK